MFLATSSLLSQTSASEVVEQVRAQQFETACANVSVWLQKEPTSDALKMSLVQCLLFQNNGRTQKIYQSDLKKALKLLHESIQTYESVPGESKQLAMRYFYAALVHWYLDQPDLSLSAFERAYRTDTTLVAALYNPITLLEELGRYREAETYKQTYRLIATNPDF